MKKLDTYIIEKILINKNTKIDKNYYILEWPNVYNYLCKIDISASKIEDIKNATDDKGDMYYSCLTANYKYDTIDPHLIAFFKKYVCNNIPTKIRPCLKSCKSINFKDKDGAYIYICNYINILTCIHIDDIWYVIMLTPDKDFCEEFNNFFNKCNFKYNDLDIIKEING